MSLSLKAAFFSSLAFISGMGWLVNAYDLQREERASRLRFAARTPAPRLTPALPVGESAETPEVWERQFAQRSTFELEAEANRRRTATITVAGSTLPPAHVPLPPLATVATHALTASAGSATASVQIEAERTTEATNSHFTLAAVESVSAVGGAARPVVPLRGTLVLSTEAALTPDRDPAQAATTAAAEPEPVSAQRYVVQRGDTLRRISQRFGGSDVEAYLAALLAANPTVRKRDGRLIAGEALVIPAKATQRSQHEPAIRREVARAPGAKLNGDAREPAARPAREPERAVASKPAEPRPARDWYTVQPKDSLANIAARYLNDGNRWREILRHNRGLSADRIVPGTRIKLPPGRLAQR